MLYVRMYVYALIRPVATLIILPYTITVLLLLGPLLLLLLLLPPPPSPTTTTTTTTNNNNNIPYTLACVLTLYPGACPSPIPWRVS